MKRRRERERERSIQKGHIRLHVLFCLFCFPLINTLAIVENDLPNDTVEHLTFVPVPSNAISTAVMLQDSHDNKTTHIESSSTTESLRSSNRNTSSSSEQQLDSITSDHNIDVTSPMLNDKKTNVSSTIGLIQSSSSPSSTRNYKPMSLTSTQTYFKTIQEKQRLSSPNIQNVQTIICNDKDDENDHASQLGTSNVKYGEKKDTIAAVRFIGTNKNGTNAKETYL